jgi:hypothetical protein
MRVVKGMVQVNGATYRVVRLGEGHYEVVRLLDDRRLGTFRCLPGRSVEVSGTDQDLMQAIARVAIQKAKTTWVGRLNLA